MTIEYARTEQQYLTPPQGGRGIYTTTDGREPMQLECRFSHKVRQALAHCVQPWPSPNRSSAQGEFITLFERVAQPSARFSPLELRYCLEKVADAYAHERVIDTAQAVSVIGAIYGRIRAALNELPEHPRLLPRRVFIQTQGALRSVLSALSARESNSELQGAFGAPELRVELERYQSPTDARKMSWLSYSQLDFIHSCLSENVLKPTGHTELALSVNLLAEITERLLGKLCLLHGDCLEKINGTRLFIPLEERKAISRPAIEHALLTSTDEECRETLKVGGLMIALGSGVLTCQELKSLGFDVDANTYMMSHGQQIQTGLRILHLIAGLAERDVALLSVLQAYSREALVVDGISPQMLRLCRDMSNLKGPLSSEVFDAPREVFHRCRSLLVQLLSNGSHFVEQDGGIAQIEGVPAPE